MKNYINNACLLLIALSFFSCQKSIPIEIIEQEPKLVVLGNEMSTLPYKHPYVQQYDTIPLAMRLFVSSSMALSHTESPNIADANISISRNGEFVSSVIYSDSLKGYESDEFLRIPGDTISIHVSKAGFSNVYASSTVPSKVEIDSCKLYPFSSEEESGRPIHTFFMLFTDPADEVNYYEVIAGAEIETLNPYISLMPHAPQAASLRQYYKESLLFTDDGFNGEQFSFFANFKTDSWGGDDSDLKTGMTLRSVTKEYYEYKSSYIIQQNNLSFDQVLGTGEPSDVESNVVGGYGVFSVYSSATRNFTVVDGKVY